MKCADIVVFTGPSLDHYSAATILAATYMPPIKRGDLKPLCVVKPKAVAIVDGEFYQTLAISPKEVLELLEAGVTVYGSSSMGALRAVELQRYGMIGVGIVFRLFRRNILNADDEVALVYEKDSQRPLSEALVNTRFALRAACRARILAPEEACQIVTAIRSTYFPERTSELTIRLTRDVAGKETACKLRAFLGKNSFNVKSRDARLLLRRLSRDICNLH
jgi:hypothetical protein